MQIMILLHDLVSLCLSHSTKYIMSVTRSKSLQMLIYLIWGQVGKEKWKNLKQLLEQNRLFVTLSYLKL